MGWNWEGFWRTRSSKMKLSLKRGAYFAGIPFFRPEALLARKWSGRGDPRAPRGGPRAYRDGSRKRGVFRRKKYRKRGPKRGPKAAKKLKKVGLER